MAIFVCSNSGDDEAQLTNPREVWFGGTFDPVHNGHLISALELVSQLNLDSVHLTPCYISPHKMQSACSVEDRVNMLMLATEHCEALDVDLREIKREGSSKTVDTLRGLRAELGDARPLIWAVGWDAFTGLHTWFEWQSIFELANIVVVERPGFNMNLEPELQAFCAGREAIAEELFNYNFGKLVMLDTPIVEISSSQIREKRMRNESVQFLLPESVVSYIDDNNLYQSV